MSNEKDVNRDDLSTLKTLNDMTEGLGIESLTRNQKLFENQIERQNEKWLATEEAAHFLSISPNALRIMVHRDQIRAYKFGRRLRFKRSDCMALFKLKGV